MHIFVYIYIFLLQCTCVYTYMYIYNSICIYIYTCMIGCSLLVHMRLYFMIFSCMQKDSQDVHMESTRSYRSLGFAAKVSGHYVAGSHC